MIKKLVTFPILGLVYLFTYFFKVNKDKITFISYNTDKLKGNFKLISNYLEKNRDYELRYVLMLYKSSLIGNITYLFNCIKQVYYINTSKVIIIDYNNYVVSCFKKKEVKVLQIWHASGAIKKFGNDVPRAYKIKNYDYVITTSDIWKEPYSSAFNVKKENVVTTGIPKCDYIFNKKKIEKYHNEMLENYPEIRDKKVILFAPTFRGDPVYNIKYVGMDLEYLKKELGEEYIIIYRVHPSFGDLKLSNCKGIINGNNISLKKIFSVTDYLISDYSALIFEFANLNKPMIFYVGDYDEYNKERGFYIDYQNTMPGPICYTEDDVIEKIKTDNFSRYNIEDFASKYFKYKDSKSTKRVCEFIDRIRET